MYRWFSAGRNTPERQRSGVTLVEILIVTVVITLMAAGSFPVYKIIQQREKEKRLRKILASVRSAISGSKSPLSAREFVEGHRTYVIAYGNYLIDQISGAPLGAPGIKKKIQENFLKMTNYQGFGYPSTPQKLLSGNYTLQIDVPTGVGAQPIFTMNIPIDRRFVRHIPPHPFIGWVPNARFEFTAAVNTSGLPTLPFNSAAWGTTASGVTNIVSRGAGLALNGTQTDGWE
jgi:hypothetical protein